MNTADLITSYLNNEMNPEQERQFLLSVAASDSMRLALKSHVMIDQIMQRQMAQTNVPEPVRNTIFAAVAASVSSSSPVSPSTPHPPAAISSGSASGGFALGGFLKGASLLLLTVGGFTAGYFIGSEEEPKLKPAVVATAPLVVPQQRIVPPSAPAMESPTLNEVVSQPATGGEIAERALPHRKRIVLGDKRRVGTPVSLGGTSNQNSLRSKGLDPTDLRNQTSPLDPPSTSATHLTDSTPKAQLQDSTKPANVNVDGTQRPPTDAERKGTTQP